jgi:hypothetical protein
LYSNPLALRFLFSQSPKADPNTRHFAIAESLFDTHRPQTEKSVDYEAHLVRLSAISIRRSFGPTKTLAIAANAAARH